MGQPLLLDYYMSLPERRPGESSTKWSPRFRHALKQFKQKVGKRYTEARLERLLWTVMPEVRQAAVLAFGLVGTLAANESLAAMLHREDEQGRKLANDDLWAVWFRGDSSELHRQLQELLRLSAEDTAPEKLLAGFSALIQKAPRFAEAYNQRAIVYFRLGELAKSIADCEKVLKLNPYHFGAAGGMAQCFMKQKKFRAALRTFRRAFRLNPNLDGVEDVIASLEKMLGEARNKG